MNTFLRSLTAPRNWPIFFMVVVFGLVSLWFAFMAVSRDLEMQSFRERCTRAGGQVWRGANGVHTNLKCLKVQELPVDLVVK